MNAYRIIISILLLFWITEVYPQSNPKDSLLGLLSSEIHDTSKITVYSELAELYKVDQLDSSIYILESGNRFCNRISSKYIGRVLDKIQKKRALFFYTLSGAYGSQGDSSNQFFYIRKCQDLRVKLNDTLGLVDIYISKGLFYSEHGYYEKAINYFGKALSISERSDFPKGIAETYNNIGYVQNNNGQVDLAVKSYYKALVIQEDIGDLNGASSTMNNLAFVYYQQDNYDRAFDLWQKSLGNRIIVGDKKLISHSLLNLGSVYYQRGESKKALEYFKKSYKIQLEIGDKQAGAYSLNNIGFIYNQQKDYKNALNYWLKSLSIRKDINDKKGQAYSLQNLSALFMLQKDYKKSLFYAEQGLELSKEIGIVDLEKTSFHRVYKANFKLKNYEKALENFTKYVEIKDSVLNNSNTQALAERDAKYKYDIKLLADSISHSELMKTKDIKLDKQRAIVQKQELETYILYGGLSLILLVLGLLYRMFRNTSKANELLKQQKDEIAEQSSKISLQKNSLEVLHSSVKDSIEYAKNIQNAILHNTKPLSRLFNDDFIFFKPKDVVSGDFYWWTEVKKHTVIATADCTGHGVPGAFMSMLGITFLREIVAKENVLQTDVILQRMRKEVIKALKQKDDDNQMVIRDGMDMSIVCINHQNNRLQYSGANNALYILTDSELEILSGENRERIRLIENLTDDSGTTKFFYELKPDKMPVGKYENSNSFKAHDVQLKEGDQLYMFSDGYADQFGGENIKKFMYKPFQRLLLSNAHLPMEDQKKALEKALNTWQGNQEQVDDIVILAVKI